MSRRVLVVEDESLIAMLIEDLIADVGFQVQHMTATVDAALSALAQGDIDLALLDVNLAGTPSFPVAEKLIERGIPFVFTTGYGQAGVPGQFSSVPVLQKPFRRAELEAALVACLPQQ
jgi:Response regulator containing CheY-like receiver, AAA-type ATPase, and DNA-binding domains